MTAESTDCKRLRLLARPARDRPIEIKTIFAEERLVRDQSTLALTHQTVISLKKAGHGREF